MKPSRRLQIPLASLMMLMVTVAVASALVAEVSRSVEDDYGRSRIMANSFHLAILIILSIALVSITFGTLKNHTFSQIAMQTTVGYLITVTAIQFNRFHDDSLRMYWLQIYVAVAIVLPLLARRRIKQVMDHGPRRIWWKNFCEIPIFAFLSCVTVYLECVFLGFF